MFHVFVALCLFGGTFLETKALESCRQFRGVENFNVTGFIDKWYTIQVSKMDLYPECTGYYFWHRENYVAGTYQEIKPPMDDTKPIPSKFYKRTSKGRVNITLISTDYQSYAILYGCLEGSESKIEILSRKLEPFTSDLNETINDALMNNSLQHINLLSIDLSDCNYDEEEVDLRKLSLIDETAKRCNNLAKGIQDFDKTRFVGHWYMVQTGRIYLDDSECRSFHCEFNEKGEIKMMNSLTTLLSEELAVQNKSNPAKFHSVSNFDDYLTMTILATDYQSYAVLYKCTENLEDGIYIMARKYNAPFSSDVEKTITDVLTNNFGSINLSSLKTSHCGKVQVIDQAANLSLGLARQVQCKIRGNDVHAYNASRFNGHWYEVQYSLQLYSWDCVSPDEFSIGETGTVRKTLNASSSFIEFGDAQKTLDRMFPIWTILSTDYETYSILCNLHIGLIKTLTRNYTGLSKEFYKTVADKLHGNEMGITHLFPIDYKTEYV